MTTEHTPGPWLYNYKFRYNVITDRKHPNDIRSIASCQLEFPSGAVISGVDADLVNRANARLIATSPDLLVLLKKAYQFILDSENYNNGGEPANRLVQDIHATISRAEGVQS